VRDSQHPPQALQTSDHRSARFFIQHASSRKREPNPWSIGCTGSPGLPLPGWPGLSGSNRRIRPAAAVLQSFPFHPRAVRTICYRVPRNHRSTRCGVSIDLPARDRQAALAIAHQAAQFRECLLLHSRLGTDPNLVPCRVIKDAYQNRTFAVGLSYLLLCPACHCPPLHYESIASSANTQRHDRNLSLGVQSELPCFMGVFTGFVDASLLPSDCRLSSAQSSSQKYFRHGISALRKRGKARRSSPQTGSYALNKRK
jgi:hypothetical protein